MDRKPTNGMNPVWVLGGLCLIAAGCAMLYRFLSGKALITPPAAVGCVVILACGVLMLRRELKSRRDARSGRNGEGDGDGEEKQGGGGP